MRHHGSNMRTFTFVLRKFAEPAKVHAFQTLVVFRTYHDKKTCFSRNRHVNMTELNQSRAHGHAYPKKSNFAMVTR